tara:strand:- start:51 stop:770 length:720 start_codon:yes stop_codon:yes gene_type:complete
MVNKKNNINNLSIIVPILKEAQNIERLVNDISENLELDEYEILFIDDDSNDGSEELLKKINQTNKKIKYFIRKNEKKDLSKSCILGFEKSLYKNILVMDGDLQHDPKDINKLINVYRDEGADIVVGSRNLFKKKNEALSFIRLTASQILIFLTSLLLGKKTEDPMSGFFIFKKDVYSQNKNKMYAKGYKILFDLIYSSDDKINVLDVDINFRRRFVGSSKMSLKIIYLLILMIIQKLFK